MLKKFFLFLLCGSLFLSATVSPAFAVEERLSDDALLDLIQRKSFDYFVYERNPANGLVKDRAHNFQRGATASAASIAAVGFALTAYPIGVERGWMDLKTAKEYTLQTLRFFLEQAPHEHGFYYHFLNFDTGERSKNSELSPIDTALFLAGVLFSAEYYQDPQIRDLADKIYDRVDWVWMLNKGKTFALEWSPENGFGKLRWDSYNESMILYLLGMGSSAHPIPAESWHAFHRPVGSYKGIRLIQHPPLFTHQYSHIWIDFRDKQDDYADYFKNSVNATLANRAFCMDQADKFETYGANSWGLTASDGPGGYKAFGAPPGWAEHDGTIAPTGCGGSIVFTPEESIACMRNFYENFKDDLWGDYGFSDAFNLKKKWFGKDVIGIDQGTILAMIENHRTGLIWKTMNQNIPLQKAMEKAGFKPGTRDIAWPDPPTSSAAYIFGGIKVDGYFKDWPNVEPILLTEKNRESGHVDDEADLQAKFRFGWDEKFLYLAVQVKDDEVFARRVGRNIWQDDMVELFVDPKGDGLYWYQKEDFQIGFRPDLEGDAVKTWSWFQEGEDPSESGKVAAKGFAFKNGYQIEAAIRWSFLGIIPEPDMEIRVTPSVHDFDRPKQEAKFQWFFRNEDELKRFVLGRIKLEPKKS